MISEGWTALAWHFPASAPSGAKFTIKCGDEEGRGVPDRVGKERSRRTSASGVRKKPLTDLGVPSRFRGETVGLPRVSALSFPGSQDACRSRMI
jgi:hypothetical protein